MKKSAAKAFAPAQFALAREDFEFFCGAILERAGIHLSDSKTELVHSRLRSRVQSLGFSSFGEYRKFLARLPKTDDEWESFTNLLTTNKTDFFRESGHFDFLRSDVVPHWKKHQKIGSRSIFKAWSAASSTGEEPYTIAMVLDEILANPMFFQILATDIDTDVLKKAERGVFSKNKLPEIPEKFRKRAFEIGTGEISQWMRIKKHLKDAIKFRPYNLIESSLPREGDFDVVFCRNVMIYFNPETSESVLNRLYSVTKSGGYLFIGHSESLQNMKTLWKPVAPSIYVKEPRLKP